MNTQAFKTNDKVYWKVRHRNFAKTRTGLILHVVGTMAIVRTKDNTRYMVSIRELKRKGRENNEKLRHYTEVIGALKFIVRILTDTPKKNPFTEEYTNHLKELIENT